MNERIKELAEQANAWYPDGYPSGEGGDAAWRDLVIFEKKDLQKFAELIVRECMDCATWVGKFNTNSVEPVHTAHAIKQRIKNQLGI